MTPMLCGLRMTGTVEFGGLKLPQDARRFELLHKHLYELLPNTDVSSATTWMGFRPSLPDHLPVIGKAPDGREIYVAFGYQHLGVKLAAVTARLIGNMMSGDTVDENLKALCISRF
jgi:glycine/D-amino acid oxidase-like deaminating enzyme